MKTKKKVTTVIRIKKGDKPMKKTLQAIKHSPKLQKAVLKAHENKTKKSPFNDLIMQIAGEEAVKITDFLKDKTNTSEFIIAEKTKIEIHKTRTILYRLLENNLASFNRKKDKIKGWYICYWDLTPKNAGHTLLKLKKEKLDKLKDRLREEQENQYYMCKNACIRMNFEKSVDFEFKCPECGEIMNLLDNKRTIEFLENNIKNLEKELPSAG